MKSPASIRFRTAVALSLGVTLLWLATALVTARLLTAEMAEVFDSALQETGQRILQLAVIDVLGRDEDGTPQQVTALNTHDEYFTYLVRDPAGQILLSSHRADPAQFPSLDAGGFAGGFHQNQNFRYYQETAVQGTIILTIAEPVAHRKSVSRELAVGLAVPILLVIPLSVLAIAYGVGFGLRPLAQLRQHLARRDAHDLAPLPMTPLPSELKPIAGTLNQLFQRLSAAFASERSFASNAAHELRTPLAGAIAQIQRLKQQTREAETARRAEDIEATLKRLTRLSERLMQLARAEGAQLAATPQDLGAVMRLVVEDFTRAPNGGGIELTTPTAPVVVPLDPDAIAIVARNLIENAQRHGTAGQDGTIRVTVTGDGWLHVENDCAAIPADDLAKLSTRFVRGSPDPGGNDHGGSGLGLAIVHTIAERLHAPMILTSPLAGKTRGFRASIQLGTAIEPSTNT